MKKGEKIIILIIILIAIVSTFFIQSKITGQALWTKEKFEFGETGCVLDSDCKTNNCELTDEKYSTKRICKCEEFKKWNGEECIFDKEEYYTKDYPEYSIAWIEGKRFSELYLKLVDKNIKLIKEIKVSSNVNNKSLETKICNNGKTMITWTEGDPQYYTEQYLQIFDKNGESLVKTKLNDASSQLTSIDC